MLKEWRKFKGWLVLEYFLKENEKIHIKGLAKKLKISPRTAQFYLQLYEKNSILRREKVGNLILYSLAENPLVFELKRFYFLLLFTPHIKKFVEKNPWINTVALYGSHASGRYDKKSDIDLLIISQRKKVELEPLRELEKKFEKEIRLQIFSIGEWRKLVSRNNEFAVSVLKNHIVLHGAPL